MHQYVHGYSKREWERLFDQAATLRELLHHDTCYPRGARILEIGCGVGAQTMTLARKNPTARITSVDISENYLDIARKAIKRNKIGNVHFQRADIFHLPFEKDCFDHVFICFLLEHLADPGKALQCARGVLKKSGSITVIEGDHGSCYFYPETAAAREVWQCLIKVQALAKGNSLIGRSLYPLLKKTGFKKVNVSPRFVYVDSSRAKWVDGFTKRTIIAMLQGVRAKVLSLRLTSEATWKKGIRDFYKTAGRNGTFCYAFFKAFAIK